MSEKIKQIQELKEIISSFEKELSQRTKLEKSLDVKIDFFPSQEVWTWIGETPNWFDIPVQKDKLEDAFVEVEIDQIRICKRQYSDTSGCCTGSEKRQNETIAVYKISPRYYKYDNILEASQIWKTKKEAIEKNRKLWKEQKEKYNKELEKKKASERARLKRELKSLDN